MNAQFLVKLIIYHYNSLLIASATKLNYLVCDTSEGSDGEYNITILVDHTKISKCDPSAKCKFSYRSYATPTLLAIIPNAAIYNSKTYFWGTVNSQSDNELWVGEYRCNSQDTKIQIWDPWSLTMRETFSCTMGNYPPGKKFLKFCLSF